MRLNPDCIRDILLQLEEFDNFSIRFNDENSLNELIYLKKYSLKEVLYHINQCKYMNFISYEENIKFITINDLFPEGHAFLADMRHDTVWNNTKSIAKSLGVNSLRALKDISVFVISEIIKSKIIK